MVVTFISEDGTISVPGWVVDIDSFRRWTDDDDFPAEGRIWWLAGEVWADMSKEQLFTHNLVKAEFTAVLHGLVKKEKMGILFCDGILFSNFSADISGNPDTTFVSNKTRQSEQIRLIEGKERGYTELQGSPDMVLEILSDSSEQKDFVTLRQAYWEAGIREYWLVDARSSPLSFDILYYTVRGFGTRRKKDGWVKSDVFGKSFRLTQSTSAVGDPEYTLEVR